MAKVAVSDGEIEYQDQGRGHPLIFVSGLGGVGRYWEPQLSAFSTRYRVVTYDQRGTGGSDRKQRTFSVDGMTSDLVGLMDALGIEKAHIVGLSTGGAIGQTLAVEHPQRLARLVAVSTWTHCDPWFRRLFEARRVMYRQAGSELHAMFHPLWLYPPDYVNTHDAEIDEERSKAVAGAPPVEVSIGRIDAIMAFDRRKDLARITAPTLIVAADNDYITPPYHAEALGRAISGSKLAIMKGGGHSVSKTRPEEFNRLVLDFLAG
ncbi:MAG TPA: alpha/beta fold hydrolase [Burkholderiales bacterium]|nr:alpha/beta fold hydrolase [Burkholderiales bacterium]